MNDVLFEVIMNELFVEGSCYDVFVTLNLNYFLVLKMIIIDANVEEKIIFFVSMMKNFANSMVFMMIINIKMHFMS